MYDKCYFCLDQLPKLKKESTASFFVTFGGAGVQKSRPTLLYINLLNVYFQLFTRDSRAALAVKLPIIHTCSPVRY